MKHIKVLLVLTLFISTGIVLCQNQEETSTEDEKMIISAIKTYNKAWETADVEMAISAYADDIYWVNSV
ncbi:MAG: hypothetical protein HRU40_22010, partial [Saprospiraceae bacterium]|nr:hypothetical protein [Saprospiraceae bacterium]